MIIGHTAIRERLGRAVERGRSAHTYLFVGPESVGKRTVALELSERLSGNVSHPDCTIINPERVEEKGKVKTLPIGVKAIREATRFLGLSHSTEAGKVLIVNDAHRMTEEAQNAFLKTLEEPFPGTTIVLVTHEEGSVLPTVVSRSERVSFGLVSERELTEHFSDVSPILWKLGRPGLAISFRENRELFDEHIRALESLFLFESLSFSERAKFAESLSNDIPYAEQLLSWWIGGLERSIVSLSDTGRRRCLLEILKGVTVTLRDLRRFPGSARLTLEHLFFFGKSVSPLLSLKISI